MTRTSRRSVRPASIADPNSEEFTRALSEHLLESGQIDQMALGRATRARSETGERLDRVLSRLGLVTDTALTRAMALILELPLATPEEVAAVEKLPSDIDEAFLRKQIVLPIADDGDTLHVALADPFNTRAVEAISYLLERPVAHCLAPSRDIERALDRLCARPAPAVQTLAGDVTQARMDTVGADTQRLRDLAAETPVIRLVQSLIVQAVESRASDIHIEPGESGSQVRFRIDGMLHAIMQIPPHLRAAVTSRIKIMARLDIAEQRMPQDGRCQTSVSGLAIDLRISTMPTANGESVVMRILDRQQLGTRLTSLGFATDVAEQMTRLLAQPTGIVLVTGPTGSGKTTTLYSALSRLDASAQKIITVEDPIEYMLPGIMQVQVQPRIGLTFASALRSILRHDPDVIMVGEIRDFETAEMAIQAALTGHLVLSTVHTNGAAATVTRLIDMGLEHYLLGSTIIGVVAQRLLRKVCPACAVKDDLAPAVLDQLGWKCRPGAAGDFYRKVGCQSCRGTGYSGRIAIGEVMTVGPELRAAIAGRASEQEIHALAVRTGMRPLLEDGLLRAAAGSTTIEEVLRATRME